jgi:GPH family glycoside/pentoside/hexuronide:cation symporter
MIWVAGDLLNYFFGGGSVSFVAFSCLAFFGSAFVNSLNWALVSDTVEYGEWRTGVRSEGTVYTGFTFFRKVSQALAGFFPGSCSRRSAMCPTWCNPVARLKGCGS